MRYNAHADYTDFGPLDKEYQEHEGPKDANTLYVQYDYDASADGSHQYTKGRRLKSARRPNAGVVKYMVRGCVGNSGT